MGLINFTYLCGMENKITLGQLLMAKSFGNFVNDKGEYCHVSRFYIKNTEKFQVVFSKGITEVATRPAINSVSEKRIVKLLTTENFKLI